MADSEAASVTGAAERPEVGLLLRCARTGERMNEDAGLAALLSKDLNWPYVLQMASEHGMMPLLFWHLERTTPGLVPVAVSEQLRARFSDNARRNLLLTSKLFEVLRLFEANEIPVIAFKGPILAASVYGNLALREFSDLDVLVRKRDVLKARELLLEVGYRSSFQLTPAQEAAFLRYNCEYTLARDYDGTVVDLHWAVAERHFSFPLDPEGLWCRAQRSPLGGSDVLTLSPEDLLLVLCVQGAKEAWRRVKYVCDVAELVRAHQDMRWVEVMERASSLGGQRMLLLGLTLADRLLGTPLPPEVWETARTDPAVEALVRQTRKRLLQPVDDTSEVTGEIPFHPLHLRMRERLRDKVRYLVRMATTITIGDWMAVPLPKLLFPLYYVLRPVRLIGKYRRRLLSRNR